MGSIKLEGKELVRAPRAIPDKELGHQRCSPCDISGDGRKRRSQRANQGNRWRYGGFEERPLPPMPESARVQCDDRTRLAAPRHLKHQASAQRATRHIDPDEIFGAEPAVQTARKSVERAAIGLFGCLSVAGQVHGDYLPGPGKRRRDRVPRAAGCPESVDKEKGFSAPRARVVHGHVVVTSRTGLWARGRLHCRR